MLAQELPAPGQVEEICVKLIVPKGTKQLFDSYFESASPKSPFTIVGCYPQIKQITVCDPREEYTILVQEIV